MPKKQSNKKIAPTKQAVQKIIDKMRPAIQNDGGDVSLAGLKDGVVRVKLEGACATCPLSTVTLKMFIEDTLKKQVPGVKRVDQIP